MLGRVNRDKDRKKLNIMRSKGASAWLALAKAASFVSYSALYSFLMIQEISWSPLVRSFTVKVKDLYWDIVLSIVQIWHSSTPNRGSSYLE